MMQVGRDVKKKGHDWKEMCAVLLIVYSASMMVSKLVFYAQSCMMEVCNEGNMLENNWQEMHHFRELPQVSFLS